MNVTIYHNPKCGTSRSTLELMQDTGIEPKIIDYLQHPPSLTALSKLIVDAGLTVRATIRKKEKLYTELGLDDPALTDDQLLTAMLANPILINRPFVVTGIGTRLCRPAELVLDILPRPPKGT